LGDYFRYGNFYGRDEFVQIYEESERERRVGIYMRELAKTLYDFDNGKIENLGYQFDSYEIEAYTNAFDIERKPGQLIDLLWAQIGKELSLEFIRNSSEYDSIRSAGRDGAKKKIATVDDKRRMLFSHIKKFCFNENSDTIRYLNPHIFKLLTAEKADWSERRVPVTVDDQKVEKSMSCYYDRLDNGLKSSLKIQPIEPHFHNLYRRWAWDYAKLYQPWGAVRKSFKGVEL